jgi:trk system potassium uptake protein TrkH
MGRVRVMRFSAVQRLLGLLLMIFSLSMLPPALVGWHYGDGEIVPFIQGFFLVLGAGLLAWWPVRTVRTELKIRDGFIVVAMLWIALCLAGTLPLTLADRPDMSFTDAMFESTSALTATGSTVLTGLDLLPHSILFYRQELNWLGGMGIVVLAVAIMPLLGVGGMQLYRAEVPGPVKDKLTPRIGETAKALWYVYFGLTVACALAYRLAGMSWFDAIGHSFSTLSLGGLSTHDSGLGFYNSFVMEMVAIVFMFLAGVNFTLHFLVLRTRSLTAWWSDSEFRVYLYLMLGFTAITVVYLRLAGSYASWYEAFRYGSFQVVSFMTTTGYATADASAWPGFLPLLLILASTIGTCAGSTGGGIKVIRVLLVLKQGMRELTRLVHPNAEIPVKVGNSSVPTSVMTAVWGFFSLYVALFILFIMLFQAAGLDLLTAISATAACINNLGVGVGSISSNFSSVNDFGTWVGSFAMLIGRLELFTLLVLLTPAFWRR